MNIGTIRVLERVGSVTGTGNNDIIGGFVGANFGSIDGSTASGNATGGTNSAVGGFAGANAQFVNFPADSVPGSSFPVGTITNSSASGSASGGPGSTVDPFIARNNPTSASNPPAFPSIIAGCGDPTCVFVNTGLLPSPGQRPPRRPRADTRAAAAVLAGVARVAGGAADAADHQPHQHPPVRRAQHRAGGQHDPRRHAAAAAAGARLRPGLEPDPGRNQFLPPGINQRIIDIPPPNETRLRTDEVVVQVRTDAMERLRAAVAGLGVRILASEDLSIIGSTAVRLHIDDGRTPAEVSPSRRRIQIGRGGAAPICLQPRPGVGRAGAGVIAGTTQGRDAGAIHPGEAQASPTCTAWCEAPTCRSR